MPEARRHMNTEFANTTEMFVHNVTADEIKSLFDCQLTKPLQASVNRHVALFFGALRFYGLLPFAWQMIMENNRLVSSSSNNQPLRASQLRCSLSQAKNTQLSKKKSSNTKIEDSGFEGLQCFCQEVERKHVGCKKSKQLRQARLYNDYMPSPI